MPDPKQLKVGDRVRFISRPDEWSQTDYGVHQDSLEFMDMIITRKGVSRIAEINEHGYPCVNIIVKTDQGREYHSWSIMENTGWRKVQPRS